MKHNITVEIKVNEDLEQCTAALRQMGLEELDRMDPVREGYSIEHPPAEGLARLHVQVDEGYADQVTTILKKCGGRSVDPPSASDLAAGLGEHWARG